MRDKRDFIALGEHDWYVNGRGITVCAHCGKFVGEVDEQEDPVVCWAEVTEIDSPYLIPPRVESAHPIEAGEEFRVGDDWWPLSIKATEGER